MKEHEGRLCQLSREWKVKLQLWWHATHVLCWSFCLQSSRTMNAASASDKLVALLEEKDSILEEDVHMLQQIKIRSYRTWHTRNFFRGINQRTALVKMTTIRTSARKFLYGNDCQEKEVRRHSQPLDLHNWFQCLLDASTPADPPHEHQWLAEPEVWGNLDPRRQRKVVVIGDSLLRSVETAECWSDWLVHEVCYLPGARIQDVTMRFSQGSCLGPGSL